jgi:SEC-C motif-containing protein
VVMSTARCPCLSGETFGACCAPFLRGDSPAPTAERLMRSRFTAFVGDSDYLLRTWHPSTAPAALDLDPEQRWTRLDILHTNRGGMLDKEGTVEFRAFYRRQGTSGDQHESSRFVKENRSWYYLDAL